MSIYTPSPQESDAPTLMRLQASDETRKKATAEPMAFVLSAAGKVNVANYAHGADEVHEHTYTVTVDEGGPIDCTCPAFEYHCQPGEACKHIVAVSETDAVLLAAFKSIDAARDDDGDDDSGEPELCTDGGLIDAEIHLDAADGERPDDCDCGDWNDGRELPCWPCYRDGFEEPARGGSGKGDNTPRRHEPADFGHGESTGVQDL